MSNKFILALAERTNINLNWLITGTGSIDRCDLNKIEGFNFSNKNDAIEVSNDDFGYVVTFLKSKFPDFSL